LITMPAGTVGLDCCVRVPTARFAPPIAATALASVWPTTSDTGTNRGGNVAPRQGGRKVPLNTASALSTTGHLGHCALLRFSSAVRTSRALKLVFPRAHPPAIKMRFGFNSVASQSHKSSASTWMSYGNGPSALSKLQDVGRAVPIAVPPARQD
jgi:hypothetical protein